MLSGALSSLAAAIAKLGMQDLDLP
jgi:hypothetical protein